jgi:hypothetical protein
MTEEDTGVVRIGIGIGTIGKDSVTGGTGAGVITISGGMTVKADEMIVEGQGETEANEEGTAEIETGEEGIRKL